VLAAYGTSSSRGAHRLDGGPTSGDTPVTGTAPVPEAATDRDRVVGGECPGCEYAYDEEVGDAREGFPPGTSWASIPDSWCCPDCGVREKVDFLPLTREVAR
jgi:alkane 1-monooxygenase